MSHKRKKKNLFSLKMIRARKTLKFFAKINGKEYLSNPFTSPLILSSNKEQK
jgi:hypothetical protein